MDEDDIVYLPPTPSPAPRLRRSPKRQILHERTHSQTNQILAPTIRPVTDPDAKVYATSPFPSSAAQVFTPGRVPGGFGDGGLWDSPWGSRGGRGSRGLALSAHPPNNPGLPQHSNTTFATAAVRDRELAPPFINASPPPPPAHGFFTHNGPRLEPSGARLRPFSYPPGEVQEESIIRTPSSAGLDVDRLAMVEGSNNVNNDRNGVSSHLTVPLSSSHLRNHELQQQSSSPYTPQTSNSSSAGERRSGLGAIASVASNLSFQSTPMSVGTAGSSGTVIRSRGFSGATPPGFYALFPPNPKPQSPESRYARPRRSSSAPPRPVSEVPLSPITAGSDSPVSPVSSLGSDEDLVSRKSSTTPRHRYSRSEELLGSTPGSRRYPIVQYPSGSSVLEPQSAGSGQFGLLSPTHSIPRKPVSRSNAVRWNSYMSTIPSESEARSSAGLSQTAAEETRRSSRAIPEGLEQPRRVSEPRRSSTSFDFATLNGPFPMPEPLYVDKRASKQRVASGGSTIRIVSGGGSIRQSLLPPRSPPPKDPRRLGSPTSTYSRNEYRDSGNQTDAAMQKQRPAGRGSLIFFRESIPAWARYSYNFSNGQFEFHNISEPIYYPPEHILLTSNPPKEIPDVLTCPNCSVRWKPEPSPNLNQSNLNTSANASAAKKPAKTNKGKRVYYADEPTHRNTIGRPLSGISDSSSRRHTIGSLTESIRGARNRRSQQENAIRSPRGLRPIRPPRPPQRDRPISMPITPATPLTPYDPSVFVGEDIRRPPPRRSGGGWEPHLWHNRQSAMKRRSVFIVPSIDEAAEKGLTRRNVQIWFFAVGFIFPLRESPSS